MLVFKWVIMVLYAIFSIYSFYKSFEGKDVKTDIYYLLTAIIFLLPIIYIWLRG
jgi:hypothetical protein